MSIAVPRELETMVPCKDIEVSCDGRLVRLVTSESLIPDASSRAELLVRVVPTALRVSKRFAEPGVVAGVGPGPPLAAA